FSLASFLQALLGSRPSCAWHDSLEGRDLLLQGIRWKLECGTMVHITEDVWLPTTPPSRPRLLPHVRLHSSQVSYLIRRQ
ncbi:unnamed protein product, partial [Linum tenue]